MTHVRGFLIPQGFYHLGSVERHPAVGHDPTLAAFPLQFTKCAAQLQWGKVFLFNVVKRTSRNSPKISSCDIYKNYLRFSAFTFFCCQDWLLYFFHLDYLFKNNPLPAKCWIFIWNELVMWPPMSRWARKCKISISIALLRNTSVSIWLAF